VYCNYCAGIFTVIAHFKERYFLWARVKCCYEAFLASHPCAFGK